MAKFTKQKAQKGKNYVCEKCKRQIEAREDYYKIVELYRKPRIRCCNCKPKRYELTSSNFLSTLWRLQDNLAEDYDLMDYSSVEEIVSVLEDLKSECENSYDNIPENLQYSPNAELLQARIDSLDTAISDLESIYEPEYDEDLNEDNSVLSGLKWCDCKNSCGEYSIYYSNGFEKGNDVFVSGYYSLNDFLRRFTIDEPWENFEKALYSLDLIENENYDKNDEEDFQEYSYIIEDIIEAYDDELSIYDDYISSKTEMASQIEEIVNSIDEG